MGWRCLLRQGLLLPLQICPNSRLLVSRLLQRSLPCSCLMHGCLLQRGLLEGHLMQRCLLCGCVLHGCLLCDRVLLRRLLQRRLLCRPLLCSCLVQARLLCSCVLQGCLLLGSELQPPRLDHHLLLCMLLQPRPCLLGGLPEQGLLLLSCELRWAGQHVHPLQPLLLLQPLLRPLHGRQLLHQNVLLGCVQLRRPWRDQHLLRLLLRLQRALWRWSRRMPLQLLRGSRRMLLQVQVLQLLRGSRRMLLLARLLRLLLLLVALLRLRLLKQVLLIVADVFIPQRLVALRQSGRER